MGVERERPHLGRWFEELTPGLRVEHAITRTITESDNVTFSTMTMNPAPLHTDFEYASTTEFGRPLVNSLLTLGLVVGLSLYETTHGTTVANLAFESVTFPAPVFHGDTIHVLTEVLAARASSSRPEVGIVTFRHEGRNQHDEVVCDAVRLAMIHRRPA